MEGEVTAMEAILSAVTSVLTTFLTWLTSIATWIVGEPLVLLFVCLAIIISAFAAISKMVKGV